MKNNINLIGILIFNFVLISSANVPDYHGIIEDTAVEGDSVTLDNAIEVGDNLKYGRICGYTIYLHDDVTIPFRLKVTDQIKGRASLEVAKYQRLDNLEKTKFKFQIEARSCDKNKNKHIRKSVVVDVVAASSALPISHDLLASAPRLSSTGLQAHDAPIRYRTTLVVRPLQGETVIKLSTDGGACRFDVDDEADTFRANDRGEVRTTRTLSRRVLDTYDVTVSVWSCDPERLIRLVKLTVKLVEHCMPAWNDLRSSLTYFPSKKSLALFTGDESLNTCKHQCREEDDLQVQAILELDSTSVAHGCDRHSNSLLAQRRFCGASENNVELISETLVSKIRHEMSNSTLPMSEQENEEGGYDFNGKTTALHVPSERFNHSLNEMFTISTWMRHDEKDEDSRSEMKFKNKTPKEHILCNSDGEGMNRHHYSLFIHNCKLIFLLRREPVEKGSLNAEHEMNIFKPAEWRWPMAEVCDDKWHHYAISVKFPEVSLYIDGIKHIPHEASSPDTHLNSDDEVIDDWPLHRSRNVHFTRLVVGACWQGRTNTLTQHFRGSLAGLNILRGSLEREDVLRCMNSCAEKFSVKRKIDEAVVQMDNDNTRITVEADNSASVLRQLREIVYINEKISPTEGDRTVQLTTQVRCSKGMILIPKQRFTINVKPAYPYVISLKAKSTIFVTEADLSSHPGQGPRPFRDLRIAVSTASEIAEYNTSKIFESRRDVASSSSSSSAKSAATVDACLVNAVDISRDDVFRYDVDMEKYLRKHNIISSIEHQGFKFTGEASVDLYQHFLRHIHYINENPSKIVDKRITLVCSKNVKFVSKPLVVKIIMTHKLKSYKNELHAKLLVQDQVKIANSLSGQMNAVTKGNAAVGTVVITVLCLGILVALVGVVVMRIRSNGQRNDDCQAEMEWDNSSLTITVNPLDQQTKHDGCDSDGSYDDDDEDEDERREIHGDQIHQHHHNNQDDEDDDSDDLETDSEDDCLVHITSSMARRNLEWDDSTLSF